MWPDVSTWSRGYAALWIISFNQKLPPVTFSSRRSRGSGNITFPICHMITWPRDQKVTWLCWRWSFNLNPHPAKYGSHKCCGSRDIIDVGSTVGRQIDMITLLQSVTTRFRRPFWHISYCQKQQNNFITKCDRFFLRNASGITKCGRLYDKVWQLLQSGTYHLY